MGVSSEKVIQRYRRLKRRSVILERRVSRKYRLNNCDENNKTNNIKKLEEEIRKVHRKMDNLRKTYILD